MKTSVELAASGIQALQVQRRGRNSYRAKASYVDETLFGSHTGHQSSAVGFDPPWVDKQPRPQRPLLWSPAVTQREADAGPSKSRVLPSTPRKTNKYRPKSRMPSYCDETLFGTKSGGQEGSTPWMKEDMAKLCPLLWTPPSASRNHPSLPSSRKVKQLRAVHQETPRSQQTDGLEAQYREHSFWKQPENNSYKDNEDALGWPGPGYQCGSRVYSASRTFQPPKTDSSINRQQDHHLPVSRPCSKGTSRPPSVRLSRATGSCKPRPPWK